MTSPLLSHVAGAVKLLSVPPFGPAYAGILSELHHDDRLAQQLREQLVDPRVEEARKRRARLTDVGIYYDSNIWANQANAFKRAVALQQGVLTHQPLHPLAIHRRPEVPGRFLEVRVHTGGPRTYDDGHIRDAERDVGD